MELHKRINKNYIHHRKSSVYNVLREIIFGVEDGMVSTLGSITGIAIGSNNHSIVILSGIVIISVESISMGIGSYLSTKSEEEMEERKIAEEREEIEKFPEEEREQLHKIYLDNGWPDELAIKMSEEASKNKELMLREMAAHELGIASNQESLSVKGGIYMFFAYVLGGIIPLASYFVFSLGKAIPVSIIITSIGLFLLGIGTAKFIKQPLLKSGLRVLIVGGVALIVGLLAGILIGK